MIVNRNPDYFLTIARERNITRAAEKLYLTQSSLSQHIAKLESDLGVTLFDRSQTPLTLTDAGNIYKRYLEGNAFLYRKLLAELNEDRLQTVDFGIGNWRGAILLPKLLPDFLAKNPGIRVRLHEFPVSELFARIEDGKVDFAIRNTFPSETPRTLVCEHITDERILLVMRKDSPAAEEFKRAKAAGEALPLHLLETQRLIALDPSLIVGRTVENYIGQNRLAFSERIVTTNNLTALRLAAAGMGFCFMIETGLQDDFDPELTAFDLETPELSLPLSFLYKQNTYLSPAALAFQEAIRSYYTDAVHALPEP